MFGRCALQTPRNSAADATPLTQTHVKSLAERLSLGRALRESCPRNLQAEWQAPAKRADPIELLIEKMRKQIKVEVNTSRNDITNGFNITYRGRDPKSTQAVAAELAEFDSHAMRSACRRAFNRRAPAGHAS